jgi:uncharacterized protein
MSERLESRLRELLSARRRAAHAPVTTAEGQHAYVEDGSAPVSPPDLPSTTAVAAIERRPTALDRLRAAAAALDGDVMDTAVGPCVVVDRYYPSDHAHGLVRIGDAQGLDMTCAPELALVGGRPSDRVEPPRPLLFVDLETTGLAGGAGTYAFLVGCAFFERHGFRTRQFFLAGYQHERPLLDAVEALVRQSAGLVSYNGKSFDVPVLETRYQYNRLAPPFGDLAHVDMLHIARRFWRAAPAADGAWPDTDSCRLNALERILFGVRRVGDVPGFEIPSRYFEFVRSGRAEPLEPVFEHNRLDLLSLAMMTARALSTLERAPASSMSARESLAAGRIFEAAGRRSDAEACYRDAIERSRRERGDFVDLVRVDALRALALRCRRDGRYAEAADSWRAIVAERHVSPVIRREALEALAIHYEHRARDLSEAHRFAQLSLAERIGTMRMAAGRHRLARLDRKLAGSEMPGLRQPGPFWSA